MSLTSAAEIRLRNANFIDGYDAHKADWLEMAKQAYEYAKLTVGGTPKVDDVAPHLALALEVSDPFLLLNSQKGTRGKYWFRDFADLIIDRTWSHLIGGQT